MRWAPMHNTSHHLFTEIAAINTCSGDQNWVSLSYRPSGTSKKSSKHTRSPLKLRDERATNPPSCVCAGSDLSAKPIQRASLPLERIYHVQTRHGLAFCVFGVGDCVADYALEEGFEDTAGFFVDHCFALTLATLWEGWGKGGGGRMGKRGGLLAEIRFTPPRRARRRMAGLVMPWMLSRRILRWRFAPPLPRPLPPFPPGSCQ